MDIEEYRGWKVGFMVDDGKYAGSIITQITEKFVYLDISNMNRTYRTNDLVITHNMFDRLIFDPFSKQHDYDEKSTSISLLRQDWLNNLIE